MPTLFLLFLSFASEAAAIQGDDDTDLDDVCAFSQEEFTVHHKSLRSPVRRTGLASGDERDWQSRKDVVKVPIQFTLNVSRASLTNGPRRKAACGRACFDSLMTQIPIKSSLPLEEYYIVGWQSHIMQHDCPNNQKVEFVHHINVKTGRSDDMEEEEMRILASHDRGAADYWLPSGYAIPIGPSGKDGGVFIEYHLLIPSCWSFDNTPLEKEASGFDLFVTRNAPTKLAKIAGLEGFDMMLKPQPGPLHQITDARLPASLFKPNLRRNLKGSGDSKSRRGRVELLSMHLHTHDMFDVKYFDILSSNGTQLFQSPKYHCGYGDEEQSFWNLPRDGFPRLEIEFGQRLRMHCVKNNGALVDHNIVFGISNGEEMCSPLMILAGSDMDSLSKGFRLDEVDNAGKQMKHVMR